MPQLRIPRVNEEFDLEVVHEVEVETLVPVKVDAATSDDRPRLVNVIDRDDAVEVANAPRTAAGSEAATR